MGKSFRALRRYDEAIGSLQTVRSICGEHEMLEYFTAVSDLVLAGVLQETNRFEEARPVFEKCQQMFPRWGATDLAAECADALQRGPSVRLRGLP